MLLHREMDEDIVGTFTGLTTSWMHSEAFDSLVELNEQCLELLAEQAVKKGFVSSLSKSAVALWLSAHDLKPWRKKLGAFPS